MRFPKAYRGVKNIYASEIPGLISAVLSILLAIAAAVRKQQTSTGFLIATGLIVAGSCIGLRLVIAILPMAYESGFFVMILSLAVLGLAVAETVMLFRCYCRTRKMLRQEDAQLPRSESQFPNP